jgi:peroxiredoxin (alkyl hydroperoxide reductase subunit C)
VLTVGDKLPDFRLRAVAGPGVGTHVTAASFPDRWIVLLYWPADFALVCASEIDELHRRHGGLVAQGAQAIGAGQDIGPLGLGWAARQGLGFPLLDDGDLTLARSLGLAKRAKDLGTLRATFVADPAGRIRWVRVSDLSAGRFMPEVLQALASAQEVPASRRARSPKASRQLLLKMCAWCKRVHEKSGDWSRVEDYIRRFTGADFSHGICPDCLTEHS